MQRTINSIQALHDFALEFISTLPKHADRATLVLLSGDLGAGKTAFVKEVAMILGVNEEVQSPTFVIERRYTLSEQRFQSLVHIDAYRLESEAEFSPLRFNETKSDAANLIFVEWPEQVGLSSREADAHLHFAFIDETTREISYE